MKAQDNAKGLSIFSKEAKLTLTNLPKFNNVEKIDKEIIIKKTIGKKNNSFLTTNFSLKYVQ